MEELRNNVAPSYLGTRCRWASRPRRLNTGTHWNWAV